MNLAGPDKREWSGPISRGIGPCEASATLPLHSSFHLSRGTLEVYHGGRLWFQMLADGGVHYRDSDGCEGVIGPGCDPAWPRRRTEYERRGFELVECDFRAIAAQEPR